MLVLQLYIFKTYKAIVLAFFATFLSDKKVDRKLLFQYTMKIFKFVKIFFILVALPPTKRTRRVKPQFFYWYKRTLYPSDTLREELHFYYKFYNLIVH